MELYFLSIDQSKSIKIRNLQIKPIITKNHKSIQRFTNNSTLYKHFV